MRSENMELKSELANLFKDLEEVKRENPNVIPISKPKPKINQSDIKNLFSDLEEASKEARVVEKKRRDYVETTPADLSNLFKELEEASKQSKNEEPRIPRKKGQPAGSDKHSDLYTDENPKGTIHGLKFATVKDARASVKKIDNSNRTHAHKVQAAVAMEQRAKEMGKTAEAGVYRSYIEKMKKITKEKSKKEESDYNPEKLIDEAINLVKEDEPESIISKTVENLDDTRYGKKQVDDIDGIDALRKDLEKFKLNIARQISDKVSTSSGGGAGSFSDLDDVQTSTAKVDGRVITFDSSINKFVGTDLTASAAGSLTGNTLASGVTASSLTSVGTLTSLTVDNVSINGATIGHTDDTDLITLSDGSVTIAGNLTVSGTTTTVNQTVVNVTDAFVFEGANADAHETTFRVDEPTADRKASLQDKTGTIALLSGFRIDATDGSAGNEGDFIVLNTSADENDRLLFEDGTSDPIAVLASHGITLKGQGWNAFQFENP